MFYVIFALPFFEGLSTESSGFHFLQLDQHATAVLGVKEDHWVAVGADLGLTNAPNLRCLGVFHRLGEVVSLEAEMVHASAGVLLEEASDGALVPQGVQQLEF